MPSVVCERVSLPHLARAFTTTRPDCRTKFSCGDPRLARCSAVRSRLGRSPEPPYRMPSFSTPLGMCRGPCPAPRQGQISKGRISSHLCSLCSQGRSSGNPTSESNSGVQCG
ncbi:hypothetical protein FA13DRAFT_1089987 [Coprinellus micaceus]|uniref:Uncharacterized protein n=1 Tax=Coprinellus micaceus TaxID=71717 RepID=A0A4Y7TRT5_COPMI|nr:hypothetical protein FA13DRAFT_1089987 [Coprinellus micaceus]